MRRAAACLLALAVLPGGAVTLTVDRALPASLYVQDGLVAQWDGIENGGTGVHQDVATDGWKDLIGGIVLAKAQGDPTTDEKGVLIEGTTVLQVYDSLGPATALGRVLGKTVKTIEIVGRQCTSGTTQQSLFFMVSANKDKTVYADRIVQWYTDAGYSPLGTFSFPLAGNTVTWFSKLETGLSAGEDFSSALVAESSKKCCIYANGQLTLSVDTDTVERSGKSSAAIGVHGWYGMSGTGDPIYVSAIRVYDRALSAAEVATNCIFDAIRFRDTEDYRYRNGRLQRRIACASDDAEAVLSVNGEVVTNGAGWVDWAPSMTVRLSVVSAPAGKGFFRWDRNGGDAFGYDETWMTTITGDASFSAEFGVKDWTYADGQLSNGDWTFAASETDGKIKVGKPSQNGTLRLVDFTGDVWLANGETAAITGFVDEALRSNGSLVVLKVPTSVTTIPLRFAAQCPELRKVVLHDGIRVIGSRAFCDAPKLLSFTPLLPPRLESLGVYAFQACPLLTEPVFLPASLKTYDLCELPDWSNSTFFDQSGFTTFVFDHTFSLERNFFKGTEPNIRELVFRGRAAWVAGTSNECSFAYASSLDQAVRMSLPATNPWRKWISDAANVTPWAQCSDEAQQGYYGTFGTDAVQPQGLTTADATLRRIWVVTHEPEGLSLAVR